MEPPCIYIYMYIYVYIYIHTYIGVVLLSFPFPVLGPGAWQLAGDPAAAPTRPAMIPQVAIETKTYILYILYVDRYRSGYRCMSRYRYMYMSISRAIELTNIVI